MAPEGLAGPVPAVRYQRTLTHPAPRGSEVAVQVQSAGPGSSTRTSES